MANTKRILVICGTGIATSTVVAQKIKEYCNSRGIDVSIDQKKVMETLRGAEGYDLVVSTTQVPSSVKTPAVSGLPFITGVGVEETLKEIESKLQS